MRLMTTLVSCLHQMSPNTRCGVCVSVACFVSGTQAASSSFTAELWQDLMHQLNTDVSILVEVLLLADHHVSCKPAAHVYNKVALTTGLAMSALSAQVSSCTYGCSSLSAHELV